ALVKAAELLEAWQDGSVDLTLADEVRGGLAEVERIARDERHDAIARLSGALLGAHERFEFASLTADAAALLGRAHEALLAQFDAPAADQTPADDPALVEALQALQPAAEAPAAAVAEVEEPPLPELEPTDELEAMDQFESMDALEAMD